MKIKQAHIDGFGKWHDQDFNFNDNPQLIYGPNEAGKTTLMAFLVSILFGFVDGRGKKRFAQYIPKDTSSYGGSVLIEVAGQDYLIKRQPGKKGGKVTVTDSDGHQGDEQMLHQLLGTMDRDLYQALFSFGQQDLAAVDEINRDDWQHHLQQLGAVGSQQWAAKIANYRKQADHLYKPRGRKWPLNQDLRRYDQLTVKIQQARGNYHRYQELRTQLQTSQARLKQVQAALATHNSELAELTHLQQMWPVYHQWQSSQDQQQSVYLSDQQVATAQKLQAQEKELARQLADYQQRLQMINQQSPTSAASQDLINLQALKKQAVSLQAEADLQHRQQVQLDQWTAELRALHSQYEHPLPAPLDSAARTELARLLQPQFSRSTPTQPAGPSQRLMLGIVVGFILFIIGLLTNATLITAIGAITTFAIIMYFYYQHNHQTPSSSTVTPPATDLAALTTFGKQHDLQAFPHDQWLVMQGDLQRNAELTAQIATANQDHQRFAHRLALFKHQLPSTIHEVTIAEINNRLDQLIADYQQASQDQQAATRERAMIANTLARLNDEAADLHQQKMAIYQQAHLHDDQQFAAYLVKRTTAQTRAATSDAYSQQLTTADKQALAQYRTRDELTTELARTKQQVNQLNQQLSATQAAIQNAQLELASLVKDGTLSNLEQERANLVAQIWDEVQEWLTYQLTVQWINRALTIASSDRYPTIMRQAEQYFAILTDHRYQKIRLTDDGVAVIRRDQVVFLVEELSQGTAEQLYIALRLGFVTVMSDQANFPVIIDDGFVNFDRVRRQRMLTLLQEIAQQNQVLYFTADERIKQLGSPVLDLQTLNHE